MFGPKSGGTQWVGRPGLGRAAHPNQMFGLGGSLMSLTGAQRFVLRLTALLAAADSERCPAPPEGVALTLTGRGRWVSRTNPTPAAAQAGQRPPRPERAARRPGARAGAANGCERGVQRPSDPAEPVVAGNRRAGTPAVTGQARGGRAGA